jgi:hypothetical protein
VSVYLVMIVTMLEAWGWNRQPPGNVQNVRVIISIEQRLLKAAAMKKNEKGEANETMYSNGNQ